MIARAALAVAIACASGACDGEPAQQPSLQAGNPRRMGRDVAPRAEIAEQPQPGPRVGPRLRPSPRGTARSPRATTEPVPSQNGPSIARAREVDYGAMVRRAFGVPTDCFAEATRRAPSGTLAVTVSVTVMGSGRITRASVQSSRLSEVEIECLQRRAERMMLPAPIPDAPRTVSTTIEYQLQSEVPPEERREVEPQEAVPGRVAPDRTLQAAGTETGRPAGSVPPSFTHPAQVP
jgi:hypothetical protein